MLSYYVVCSFSPAAAVAGKRRRHRPFPTPVSPEPTASPEPTPTPTPTPKPTATPEPTPTPYVSPIDFASLQAGNPDIYAWIRIADTVIDYPVVQNPDHDEYYLHYDSDRNVNLDGAIFSQATYNSVSFDDPVTVLYGHNMKSGNMFGTLRAKYTDQQFFNEHKDIVIYTPEEELTFKVFAAVPFSNEHILYEHNFWDEHEFENFFDSVFNMRDLSALFDEENKPVAGDRVLILSTCISGTNQRFLVMASLKPDLENRSES